MTSYSCLVTGTDTGVGKTLVTCSIIRTLFRNNIPVIGMKPVASGITLSEENEWHNDDVEAILKANPIPMPVHHVAPYRFKAATSPNIAAKCEQRSISWSTIHSAFNILKQHVPTIVVEGVGGFMVPFSEHYTAADLAVQLQLPIVLVVGLQLGCINHALLTVEALLSRNLYLAGWIANTVDEHMAFQSETIATLANTIPAPCLARIPYLDHRDPDEVLHYFDSSLLKSQLKHV